MNKLTIINDDNLSSLLRMPANSINLIYIDPPFNTLKTQKLKSIKTKKDENGKRKVDKVISEYSFEDTLGTSYLDFLKERVVVARNVLSKNGSFFCHVDYREVHYVKVMLDEIFGRKSFMNEIIWSYDYGAKSKKRYSTKHDNILWYTKDSNNYIFNYDKIDRVPYLAPSLCGPEKAKRGKAITDVWFNTIVPTNGKERTGYPTQKPLKILERIVKMHSNEGDLLLDFFAGSGSFGEAAIKHNRDCILIDNNSQAIEVMKKRFADVSYTTL